MVSCMSEDEQDIGTILEVPEDQRLDVDPDDEEPNEDEGHDVSQVPDGEIYKLSTAEEDD